MEAAQPTKSGSETPVDAELSRPELLHELFEQQAETTPSNIALFFSGQQMTYAELEMKANRLARFLRAKGVGKGCSVALLLPRSLDLYVALLAILKAGAAYVPLDPDSPPERLAYILSDCGAQALVTLSFLTIKCAGFAGIVVELDRHRPEIAAMPEAPVSARETGVTWDDPCYIIYTSGSTGRPKGVLIEHRSACNLVRAEAKIFQVQPSDRVYQGFSIAFDASVEEICLAFLSGASLVVATPEMVDAG